MKRAITSFLFIVYTFAGAGACMAQEPEPFKKDITLSDFIPGEKVLFEDDFSQDAVGKFPSKWRLYPTISKLEVDDSITNTGVYPIKVEERDGEHVLEIASDNHYFPIKPKLNNKNYLKDTFTIEFDFRMDDEQSDPAIVFFDEQGNNIFECRILGSGEILSMLNLDSRFSVDYPDLPFTHKAWHHFAISFMHRQIKCYIDQYKVLVVPDCHTAPGNFIIAGNSYVEGNPVVAFRRFKYAANVPVYLFNKIRTESKFTTHAIHFQKGQSAIEPESTDFIKRLADWLNKNRDIKMEIDGYTDNDGDRKTNIKLSQERANAVKAALEERGIDGTRLSANGFGEDNPLDTNDTPEGKAQNRRVEFVRK